MPVSEEVELYGISQGGDYALLVTWLMARDEVPRLTDAVAVHALADFICGASNGGDCWHNGDLG